MALAKSYKKRNMINQFFFFDDFLMHGGNNTITGQLMINPKKRKTSPSSDSTFITSASRSLRYRSEQRIAQTAPLSHKGAPCNHLQHKDWIIVEHFMKLDEYYDEISKNRNKIL